MVFVFVSQMFAAKLASYERLFEGEEVYLKEKSKRVAKEECILN